MKLSQRAQQVAPSATLAMTARAKAMKSKGIDVLAMSAGEPDFPPPKNVLEAAGRAVDEGMSKYTPVPGTPELRRAVAQHFGEFYGTKFEEGQTIVSAGGKQVLFNACCTMLDPGDEAIIFSPYWVSYPDMIRFAGATPVVVDTTDDTGFVPTAAQLKEALTPKTRLVILNSPSNPTGALFPKQSLKEIAAVLADYPDVWVISDDIYHRLVFDGDFVGLAHVAPELLDRMLIVGGVSKTYAMTGWRVGFGVGPAQLIGAMSRIQGASTSGASCIAQAGAVAAITGDQEVVESMRQSFHQRRDRIVEGLRQIPDVTVTSPGGAFYVFPNVSAYLGERVADTLSLCEHLLETAHVATVPGSAFGANDYIRLSFACSEETIDEGVARLGKGLAALR